MGKNDDSGLIGERRGTSGFVRGPDGDHGRQSQGGVPGKRTAVPEGRPVDPITAFLRRLDAIGSNLDGIAARQLPAMRAAIAARAMDDARRTGGDLAAVLGRVDTDLNVMKQQALLMENAAALAMIAPLETRRDACRADAAPLLALVPPPAPALSLDAAFAPHLCLDELAQYDAAEAETRAAWSAEIDANEAAAQPAVAASDEATNVIDAGDRFRRNDEVPATDAAAAVQRRAAGSATDPERVHAHAAAGVAGTGTALPHIDVIQRSFGAHDITGVSAHVGGAASEASAAIGAEAYATGNHVAFAEQPSLFVAAHEAAHVVQQRAGVSLLGGVGKSSDSYEQHADAVADKVVRGESAEALLGEPDAGHVSGAVQRRDDASEPGDEGSVSSIPRLTLDKPAITFGEAQTGETYTEFLHVTNDGDEQVHLEPPRMNAPFEAYFTGPLDLDPGEMTVLMIVYRPTVVGALQAVLSITVGDDTGLTVFVSGMATAPPVQDTAPPGPGPMAPQPMGPQPFDPMFPWRGDGTDEESPPPAQEAPKVASQLSPWPVDLRYGEDADTDLGSVIKLWNNGPDTVTIDDVYVAGGQQAFTGQLLDGNDVEPGAAAHVGIEYRPDLNTGDEATLVVLTSDGAMLEVPMSGPTAQGAASGPIGSLEISPTSVRFERTVPGQNSSVYVLLRNRGVTPVKIANVKSYASEHPAFTMGGQVEIGPGRAERVSMYFAPPGVGDFSDTIYITDGDGRSYGWVLVSGQGVEQAEEEIIDHPSPAVCEPIDAATAHARTLAGGQLMAWSRATEKTTKVAQDKLILGWSNYLSYTSGDPTISRQTVPDASILRAILSNGFGNALADQVVKPDKRVAGFARSVVNKVGPRLGIDEPGRVVARLAGGAGFVIGVLVETLAGMLFDAIAGDDAVEDALEEAYEQGGADLAEKTGKAIAAKITDLNAARDTADAERIRQELKFQVRIEQSCSAAELEQLAADLVAKTADAEAIEAAKPNESVSTGLLVLWTRDHATSTTGSSKGLNKQWEKATAALAELDSDHFEKGKLKNQADLFMAQCLHEWAARGLPTPPELQTAVYEEMGGDDAVLSDPGQAAVVAERLKKRFDGREFVWGMHNIKWAKLEKGLGWGGTAGEGQESVSCRPVLAVADGCCIVTRFDYRIARGVHDVQTYTKPGDPAYHDLDDRSKSKTPPPHVQSLQLYDYMASLQAEGLDVARDLDAENNSALLAQFGDEMAIPTTTHADGRGDPVVVYRVRALPSMTISADLPVRTEGDLRLVRGGNTILLIEP